MSKSKDSDKQRFLPQDDGHTKWCVGQGVCTRCKETVTVFSTLVRTAVPRVKCPECHTHTIKFESLTYDCR